MNNTFYKPVVMFKSIIALLVLACFVMPIGIVRAQNESRHNNIFRLHILANSNSIKDQAIKMKVRDAVLAVEAELFENAEVKDSEAAKQLIMDNAKTLLEAIESTLRANCVEYGAQMIVGDFEFPDRMYSGTLYEAGEYEALRIVLGAGNGENWWCVMYPPLCIKEPYSAQNGTEEKCEPKSLIVELYVKLSSWFSGIFN